MRLHLNHAGTSWPKPERVRRAVMDALLSDGSDWAEMLGAQHRRVAEHLGAADVDRLLLTAGCTSALSVAVADLPWQTGDRIIISSFEHHALHRPARLLEQRGVECLVAPPAGDSPLDLDWLEATLRRGGTRLVAITAASNVTGALLPFREARELARRHGALFLLDAAQLAGWVDLDLPALGDLVTFAGHKGPQAPWGIGGLYVAPEVDMAPLTATCELAPAGPRRAPMPGACDVGSVDRLALAGLRAGLDWLAERTDRLAAARGGIARLAGRLEGLPGVTLHGPRSAALRVPSLALTVAGLAPDAVAARLGRRDVTVGAGLLCAPLAHLALGTAPDGVVRLSVGPATSDLDLDAAGAALADAIIGPS